MKTKCPLCGSRRFIYLINKKLVTVICSECKKVVGKTLNYKSFLITPDNEKT
jgi:endogenous inhibitor of DNA gyrase (YacG/DUF329 family)